jgi:hypothetical protein
MDPAHVFKTVFVADAHGPNDTQKKVVIKFTDAYNRAAHRLLAGTHAPHLCCAFEPTVNMWVFIMDCVPGQPVENTITAPAHIASLRAALHTLHDQGFVHGDLREPNMLLVHNRVMLIDFGWCGLEGVAAYPSDISMKGEDPIPWASGVGPGARLRKEHDRRQFKRLTDEAL